MDRGYFCLLPGRETPGIPRDEGIWLGDSEPEIRKGIAMPFRKFPTATPASLAVAVLLGATMLASPVSPAYAQTPPVVPVPSAGMPANSAAAAVTETKVETVEQRIATLHAALKITPDQDVKWKAVAQAMRENAAAMEKLIAEANVPRGMSAVDDLVMYRKFAQAHVDGLKNLIDDFKLLYASMPAAQKKIADDVFKTAGV